MKKYSYYKVIQKKYGYNWDDVSHYETNSQGILIDKTPAKIEKRILSNGEIISKKINLLQHDLTEYKSMDRHPTRVIFRKEKN